MGLCSVVHIGDISHVPEAFFSFSKPDLSPISPLMREVHTNPQTTSAVWCAFFRICRCQQRLLSCTHEHPQDYYISRTVYRKHPRANRVILGRNGFVLPPPLLKHCGIKRERGKKTKQNKTLSCPTEPWIDELDNFYSSTQARSVGDTVRSSEAIPGHLGMSFAAPSTFYASIHVLCQPPNLVWCFKVTTGGTPVCLGGSLQCYNVTTSGCPTKGLFKSSPNPATA